MVGIDALFGDGESLSLRQVVGLAVGFTGILVSIWPRLGTAVDAECSPVGSWRPKWRARAGRWVPRTPDGAGTSQPGADATAPAFEMLFGGLVLFGMQPRARASGSTQPFTSRSAVAVVYLIVFGSIIAFSSYRYALQHLPVATMSLYVYVNTVIAVILGTVVLAEPFNWRTGAGVAVVLVGIAPGQKSTTAEVAVFGLEG